MVSKKTGIILLIGITLLMILIGLLLPPIPQPQNYHQFAEQRRWLGINNVWNVLSNIPFALAGIWGLFLLLSHQKLAFVDSSERRIWITISLGLILVALGSSYYHLTPNNTSLVWDRLPMTIVFMSFVAILIADRINSKLGFYLWPFLVAIGIYSVLQWHASELNGKGDVRLYATLQAYTTIVAMVMLLIPSRYTRAWDLAIVILFYVLAKLFELFDDKIDMLTGGMISGHTLKHLAAGMAGVWLIKIMWKRKIILA